MAYRVSLLSGFSPGVMPQHLRHAHSHVMLMGWATPGLMIISFITLSRPEGRFIRSARAATWIALVLSLLSTIPFLGWGYGSVPLGSTRLPLASMISGLAICSWYVGAAVYLSRSKPSRDGLSDLCWRTAYVLLLACSVGAWALAFVMTREQAHPLWAELSLHLFVDLFGEGWITFCVLALLFRQTKAADRKFSIAIRVLSIAVLPTFVLGVDPDLLPSWLALTSRVAVGVSGLALMWIGLRLRPHLKAAGPVWRGIRLLLLAKAAGMVVAAAPGGLEWALSARLRLVYLHLLFAGMLTPALYATAAYLWGERAFPRASAFTVVC
ncbi:MAG: hypothetical protein KC561_10910, partial [Myxococcales bacterium]|nr:hypothetical protein [Myxococcales bacterium]